MIKKIFLNTLTLISFFLFAVGVSMMNTEILKGLLVTVLCIPFGLPAYLDWRKDNEWD